MSPGDLLAALETIGDAPEGVERLRQLVLQLAVCGQLVPQDPKDEPAGELLKRIVGEKAELVRAGDIRKPKPLPPVTQANELFPLPEGWAWTRLESIHTKLGAGSTPLGGKKVYTIDGVPFLRSQNVWNEGLRLDDVARIPDQTHSRMSETHVQAGDVLLNITGASIARSCVVPDNFETANVSQHVAIVRQVRRETNRWVHTFLISPLGYAAIMGVQVGISREGLAMGRLREFVVPFPPLAEQRRIVARVDELMALLDDFERTRDERDGLRVSFRDSALAALQNAEDAQAAQIAWSRIASNLDRCITDPADVAPLRQTILQLAVRGRLVPQDAGDEPASDVVLGDTVSFLNGYAFKSSWYTSDGIRLVRNQNVGHGNLSWKDRKCLSAQRSEEFSRFALGEGDIVLSLDRPFISTGLKIARIQQADLPCLLLQRVACPRPKSDRLSKDYLYLWFQSPEFEAQADPGRSNGVPHISTREVEKMTLRLPPLAEQRRIVAKADELMAICDELEALLTEARDGQSAFAAAAVHHLDLGA